MTGVRAKDWEIILGLAGTLTPEQVDALLALAFVYGDRDDQLDPSGITMVGDSCMVTMVNCGEFEILKTGAVRQAVFESEEAQ